ncbi:hypothetical protein ASPNIDRAFT_52063 [Aspergillus niger ATCC 1015]|uniref:Uncharacterized protein n=1 Tax=Aspergillus niger (strain ATCC 1015 / CBS 113.46 / FGSC A1144 / LSHB Ac4 / NCTC 3858a / NRRL 328 / USDA 3528.7) TaxID=380704 RepID=G3XQI0_ASPNA|nr:uncharacterized protein BO96DRAFT_402262 [Aspergillus niger CBS 101883]EHA26122.1 hypothetical protein ASPNIDRAFT_52063 [Aspergillus niger ATCC 1015]PYH52150.1 hypothetical protein BO96DRAFT_402262 [Aspergillus niger CBS 101883]
MFAFVFDVRDVGDTHSEEGSIFFLSHSPGWTSYLQAFFSLFFDIFTPYFDIFSVWVRPDQVMYKQNPTNLWEGTQPTKGYHTSEMAPLTLEDARAKLREASKDIQRRDGLKDSEAKRVREAVSLLQAGLPDSEVKVSKRQSRYRGFLQKVQGENPDNGDSMVVLCAVALGISVIAIARDTILLNLPFTMKDEAEQLLHPCLHRLANQYFGASNAPSSSPAAEQLLTAQGSRRDLLFNAVKCSRQWEWERNVGGGGIKATTDCLNVLVPEDRNQDISITLLVGHEQGLALIEKASLCCQYGGESIAARGSYTMIDFPRPVMLLSWSTGSKSFTFMYSSDPASA